MVQDKECSKTWDGYGIILWNAESILRIDYLKRG
jgi:hypothetical protein